MGQCDKYLDDRNFRLEPCWQLCENFTNQILMIENFTHFHDTYNSCLYQKFSVLFNVLMCGFLFDLQFGFKRDIYVDS